MFDVSRFMGRGLIPFCLWMFEVRRFMGIATLPKRVEDFRLGEGKQIGMFRGTNWNATNESPCQSHT